MAQPVASNRSWRLSLLSVGGGPLVLATIGAAAQRVILAPSLRRLAGGASALRRSRLRAATAAADDDDYDDARVRTRASSAAADGPSEGGAELADTGLFGNNDRRTARTLRAKRVARRVLEREIGGAAYGREKVEAQLAKHVGGTGGCGMRLTVAGARAGIESRSHRRIHRQAVYRAVFRRRVVLHHWRE